MRYMCLVYFEDGAFEGVSAEALRRLTDESITYDRELRDRGHLLVASGLEGPETAVSVRVRKGKLSATDGPYAETKELVGGFLLLEARDMAEAVGLLETSPVAPYARIEVRPLLVQTHSETGAGRPDFSLEALFPPARE